MLPIVKADGVQERQLLGSLRSRSAEVDKEVTRVVSEILENVVYIKRIAVRGASMVPLTCFWQRG